MEGEATKFSPRLLSEDLIANLLLRLPAKSIGRFRSVCKCWLSISANSPFLLNYARRSPNYILIQTTNYNSDDLHINLQLLPPTADTVLPERRRNTFDVIYASCHGLLCLLDESNNKEIFPRYYVINPLTGAQVDAAKPTCPNGYLVGFYFHPIICEYHLLRKINLDSDFSKLELISLNGEAWRMIDSSPPEGLVWAGTPVDVNGMLYWIAHNTIESTVSGILGFDIIKEEFKLLPLPSEDVNSIENGSLSDIEETLCFLNFDKELSLMGELGIDIWVLKDFENIEWRKIHSVKCFNKLEWIDFQHDYWVDDIALSINKEKIVVIFFSGFHSYLIQFNLKSKEYNAVQILDDECYMMHVCLLYKESIVSHDSFSNR